VNAITLLLGLLALSYVGSVLRGERAIRGMGLASGAEYVCLGIALGPHALGVISDSLLESFEPLLVVGASWLTFIAGLGYGRVGERSIAPSRALLGLLGTLLVGAAVFGAVYAAVPVVAPTLLVDRPLLAAGAASVAAATTRQAVRWVVQRHRARGALADTLADHAQASALVPVLGVAVLIASQPAPGLAAWPLPARIAATFGIGVALGSIALALLSRGLTRDERWGILVGTSLLSMGVAARLGLAPLGATFALGLMLGAPARRHAELSPLVRPTERAVLLPMAVLAGALLDPRAAPAAAYLVPIALAARFAAELGRSLLLLASTPAARPAGIGVGYSLVSTGDVTLACAVSIALALDHPLSRTVLAIGIAGLLLGEVVAPLALRRALGRAGELDAPEGPVWSSPPEAPGEGDIA
jgi:hypothetical protein